MMYVGVTSESFDLEDEANQKDVSEWVFNRVSDIINISEKFS